MIITSTEQFFNFKSLEIYEPIIIKDITILPKIPGIYLLYAPNEIRPPYGGMAMDLWYRFNYLYKWEINSKRNRPILHALRKYGGFDNFRIEIFNWWTNPVESVEVEALETAVIDEYDCLVEKGGYNVCLFNSSTFGAKQSEESNKKRSEKLKGEKSPCFGKHHTKETKKLMSEQRKGEGNHRFGTHLTNEQKEYLSKLAKVRDYSWNNTKIKQIDPITNKVIATFNSVKEASKIVGLKCSGNISNVLKNRTKKAGGFKWEYVKPNEEISPS